jgi:hypothetical protein
MKAKNSKAVTHGYLLFAVSLFCSILIAVGCVWFFILTSGSEVAHIEKRSLEYDAIFEQQIVLTDEVDLLYHNLALLNSDQRINELVLQNKISTQKMNLINSLNGMNDADALLYKKMSDKVNDILEVRDSIRIMRDEVNQTKRELQRCIQDNRDASRKMIFTNNQ